MSNDDVLSDDDHTEEDDYLTQIEGDAEDEADEDDAAKAAKEEAERVAKKRAEEHPGEEPPFAMATPAAVVATPQSAPKVARRAPKTDPGWAHIDRPDLMTESRDVGDWTLWKRLGIKFQDMLYALARKEDVRIAVETGVYSGVSTRFLLEAVHANVRRSDVPRGEARVYSCDPSQTTAREASESGVLDDPMWKFFNEQSVTALPKIAAAAPSWDLFLHDSDHRLENMVFELEYAWHLVRDGGVIVCDDWDATFEGSHAGDPHGAWERFVAAHRVEFWWKMGTAAACFRTPGAMRSAPDVAFDIAIRAAVAELRHLQPSVTPQFRGYLR